MELAKQGTIIFGPNKSPTDFLSASLRKSLKIEKSKWCNGKVLTDHVVPISWDVFLRINL